MSSYTFDECVKFHRMASPGLASGYVLSNYAMKLIGAKREDELFCVVECQSCITNAAQLITGCTVARGDLVIRDTGKSALTLVKTSTGDGVRVYIDNRYLNAESTGELVKLILETPAEEQCRYRAAHLDIPEKKSMEPAVCSVCGERFLKRYAVMRDGLPVCPDCAEDGNGR